MIAFLLSLILSHIAALIGPAGLIVLAVILLVKGMRNLAIIAAVAGGMWFVSGVIYQEGAAACERRVAAAVEAEKARWLGIVAASNAALRKTLDGLSDENAAAEDQLEALRKAIALRPVERQCLLTDDDARAIDQ